MRKAFELKILPDGQLTSIAKGATAEYAKHFFKDEKSINELTLALEKAIENILKYSMSSRLEEITIIGESGKGKVVISVIDKGVPKDFENELKGEDRSGVALMTMLLDEVKMENLGREGRCQKLVKYHSRKSDFTEYKKAEEDQTPIENAVITVRRPQPGEVEDICRQIYREYGLTYCHGDIYYPEIFLGEIEEDVIHSIVAVDENNNIAGHHASWQWSILPGVWESGMAVVNSCYRGAGVFGKMMEVTRDYVLNQRKAKLFISSAVTFHTATQKLRLKIGDYPCGYAINSGSNMAGTFVKYPDERHCCAYACSTYDKSGKTVYLPEEVVKAAEWIYAGQSLPRDMITDDIPAADDHGTTVSEFYDEGKYGQIAIQTVGKDSEKQLVNDYLSMKNNKAEAIELYIAIDKPGSVDVYEKAKALGFFFTGIFPCTDLGDIMIMANCLSDTCHYDHIETTGPFTEMLEIVRRFDPDQIAEEAGESDK